MSGMDWIELLARGIQDTAQFGFDAIQSHKNRSHEAYLAEINSQTARDLNQLNIDYQEKFAKEGIQWKVADAIKAGIHPLYALGASTNAFQPVHAMFERTPSPGRAFSNLGRNMGNSLYNFVSKISKKKDLETIRNMELQNDILELEKQKQMKDFMSVTARLRSDGVIEGQNDSIGVDYQNRQTVMQATEGIQPGIGALENYDRDSNGYLWLKATQENQEMLESSWFDQFKYIGYRLSKAGKAVYYYYNPNSKEAKNHRQAIRTVRPPAPAGFHWRFNPYKGFKLYSNKKGVKFYENDPPNSTTVHRYKKNGASVRQKVSIIKY